MVKASAVTPRSHPERWKEMIWGFSFFPAAKLNTQAANPHKKRTPPLSRRFFKGPKRLLKRLVSFLLNVSQTRQVESTDR